MTKTEAKFDRGELLVTPGVVEHVPREEGEIALQRFPIFSSIPHRLSRHAGFPDPFGADHSPTSPAATFQVSLAHKA
jgi:hypothetical protein